MATNYEEVAAAVDFGTATARKSGRTQFEGDRNKAWPYVPVIQHTPAEGHPYVEQIRGLAYKTRAEAINAAERTITRRRKSLAEQLARPYHRALREQYGLPRELET